ncbi:AMP-binding protein [Actinomadura graeca]|uniref:AMP-binding protein n=1 Tax=Actinomadura graeca TaxID=2750812 RepID=A0ABX8QXE0_9ACTN|nr:AMP-binding protein [Actinomadura graeca]QXJ21428.1 AMP-binding protein [Actinomadura graeca]
MPAETRARALADLVPRLLELEDGAVHHLVGTELVRRPYPELYADVRRIQERLKDAGVAAGTRVGLWGGNSYAWVAHELALLDLGCVTVTLPSAEFAGVPADELAERYGLELLLADEDRCAGAGDAVAPLTTGPPDGRKIRLRPSPEPLGPDVFSVVFSSGTTGAVKAIQISRAATEDCLAEFARHHAFRSDDRILVGLPLATFQQRIMLYCALWYGFDAVIVDPSPLMLMVLKRARPTIMGGPPAFYELLENRFGSRPAYLRTPLRALSRVIRCTLPAGARRRALALVFRQAHAAYGGRMRLMLSGSAPLRASTAEVFAMAGLPLFQLYGLTESGFIAWNSPAANRVGSVGRPVFPGSVRIAPDGEILVRWPRPQSPGYLGEPPEVEAATYRPDGWIATGDLGRFDGDGYLYVIGRKKDVIITRAGYKIAPSPIEQRILADPAAAQAVLLGGGDLGYVGVVVALRAHAPDEAADRIGRRVAGINADLPAASEIHRVLFTRDEFTRENGLMTSTLKIDRGAVARRYAGSLDRGERWSR